MKNSLILLFSVLLISCGGSEVKVQDDNIIKTKEIDVELIRSLLPDVPADIFKSCSIDIDTNISTRKPEEQPKIILTNFSQYKKSMEVCDLRREKASNWINSVIEGFQQNGIIREND